MEKFNKIFNNYYKISEKIGTYNSIERFNGKEETNRKSETCLIRVYSKTIYEGLVKNGIVQNKIYSTIFPKIEDKVLFLHFLRGYIDGDGSYCIKKVKGHKYPRISIQAKNKLALQYIVDKLNEDFGIKAYIHKDRECFKFEISRKHDYLQTY